MRVLIVNTSEDTGGAAIAARRLMESLNNNGIKARMLVRDKVSEDIKVIGLKNGFMQQWRMLRERLGILLHLHFSSKHLYDIDTAGAGCDITGLREFKEADVIHLNAINQSFLSLRNIRKIINSGKPVVWTMHDTWPATAICHDTAGCHIFMTACMQCRYLPGGGSGHDLSHKIWKKKRALLADSSIYFVAASKYLEAIGKKSALLVGQKISYIPPTLDMHIYNRLPDAECRHSNNLPADRRLILAAPGKDETANSLLIGALNEFDKKFPDISSQVCVMVIGACYEKIRERIPQQSLNLGYVNNERRMVEIYNAADVYVFAGRSLNIPNTIMESMACGTPVVAFATAALPEIIDHKRNGYLATKGDAADMARGIAWILSEADAGQLSDEAVRKISTGFSQTSVAMRYIEVYNTANAFRRYRL